MNLRANPAAVVEHNPATGANSCPATSARWRSNPTRKSAPASCADATPDQQFTAGEPAVTGLDRPDRHVPAMARIAKDYGYTLEELRRLGR